MSQNSAETDRAAGRSTSNYGATGLAIRPVLRLTRDPSTVGGSFDLYDAENDDEYEYLPLPEIDENYLDEAESVEDSARREATVQRRIPFGRIHESPIPFDSANRRCFMPGQPINVQISRVEQTDQTQLLKSNLYVIDVTHGEYKWTVRRRHKHFRSLHDSLVLLRAKAIISVPTTKEVSWRRTYKLFYKVPNSETTTKPWLMLKDTFVAYMRPQDGAVSDVMLMDRDFSVKCGLTQTGIRHGLLISNLSRHLLLNCWTDRKCREWYKAIQQAVQDSGGDYVEPNRYDSFVPVRPNSYTSWFVDGAGYMAAVADGLEAAKEEIFITDWMLSPELHLKRPAIDGDKWRLDKILERKANEGVKIFILIYKEMEMALGINSHYTKSTLTRLHPTNIKVLRHPDGIKLWSHHEKCVVIDQRLAFLGGIDLCYGRWDTRTHRLTDLAQSELTRFYGQEDMDTLQNVLHNIPNIVPVPGLAAVNNNQADDTKAMAARNPAQGQSSTAFPARSALQSITEDEDSVSEADPTNPDDRKKHQDSEEQTSPSEAGNIDDTGLSVRQEPGGGFVNPVVVSDDLEDDTHSEPKTSPENEQQTGRGQMSKESSKDSSSGRKLVRQKNAVCDDSEGSAAAAYTERRDEPAATPHSDASSKSKSSSASSLTSEDDLTTGNTTMHRFLEMIRTRPDEALERINAYTAARESESRKDREDHSVPVPAATSVGLSDQIVSKLDDQPDNLCLTDEQKAAMFGIQSDDTAQVTPKMKRKAKLKAVVDFKMMFQKQRAESVDVTDDSTQRHWDHSVYEAKEQGEDSEFDASLARQGLCGPLKIWLGKDYVNFIFRDFVELDKPFTDMIDRTVTPRMPWHDIAAAVFGKPARDVARHFIQRWNFAKLEKKKTTNDIPMLLPKSNCSVSVPRWAINSAFCCNCQILRSCSEWSAGVKTTERSIYNAYIDLILTSKHYIYIENQFFISIHNDSVVQNELATAIFERIVQAHRCGETFRVYIIIPLLPAFEGEIGTTTGTSIQAVIHWNYSSICRGGRSLLERLIACGVQDPFNYISFYGLRKHEEMRGKLTTELVYVHSKLMIVDDYSVLIGSANINDRSLTGARDSELAILVQDTCSVDSVMDGKPFKAGAFACSLRKSLFREHLGVSDSNPHADITDPVSAEFYKNVWLKQASINTSVYDKVFCCIPTDEVRTLRELREYQKRSGLAQSNAVEARRRLGKVKGHLVLLPLQFLASENLTPAAGTKEALAPTVIWT